MAIKEEKLVFRVDFDTSEALKKLSTFRGLASRDLKVVENILKRLEKTLVDIDLETATKKFKQFRTAASRDVKYVRTEVEKLNDALKEINTEVAQRQFAYLRTAAVKEFSSILRGISRVQASLDNINVSKAIMELQRMEREMDALLAKANKLRQSVSTIRFGGPTSGAGGGVGGGGPTGGPPTTPSDVRDATEFSTEIELRPVVYRKEKTQEKRTYAPILLPGGKESSKNWVNAQDLAKDLGVNRTTIYRWIKSGKVEGKKDSHGKWWVNADTLKNVETQIKRAQRRQQRKRPRKPPSPSLADDFLNRRDYTIYNRKTQAPISTVRAPDLTDEDIRRAILNRKVELPTIGKTLTVRELLRYKPRDMDTAFWFAEAARGIYHLRKISYAVLIGGGSKGIHRPATGEIFLSDMLARPHELGHRAFQVLKRGLPGLVETASIPFIEEAYRGAGELWNERIRRRYLKYYYEHFRKTGLERDVALRQAKRSLVEEYIVERLGRGGLHDPTVQRFLASIAAQAQRMGYNEITQQGLTRLLASAADIPHLWPYEERPRFRRFINRVFTESEIPAHFSMRGRRGINLLSRFWREPPGPPLSTGGIGIGKGGWQISGLLGGMGPFLAFMGIEALRSSIHEMVTIFKEANQSLLNASRTLGVFSAVGKGKQFAATRAQIQGIMGGTLTYTEASELARIATLRNVTGERLMLATEFSKLFAETMQGDFAENMRRTFITVLEDIQKSAKDFFLRRGIDIPIKENMPYLDQLRRGIELLKESSDKGAQSVVDLANRSKAAWKDIKAAFIDGLNILTGPFIKGFQRFIIGLRDDLAALGLIKGAKAGTPQEKALVYAKTAFNIGRLIGGGPTAIATLLSPTPFSGVRIPKQPTPEQQTRVVKESIEAQRLDMRRLDRLQNTYQTLDQLLDKFQSLEQAAQRNVPLPPIPLAPMTPQIYETGGGLPFNPLQNLPSRILGYRPPTRTRVTKGGGLPGIWGIIPQMMVGYTPQRAQQPLVTVRGPRSPLLDIYAAGGKYANRQLLALMRKYPQETQWLIQQGIPNILFPLVQEGLVPFLTQRAWPYIREYSGIELIRRSWTSLTGPEREWVANFLMSTTAPIRETIKYQRFGLPLNIAAAFPAAKAAIRIWKSILKLDTPAFGGGALNRKFPLAPRPTMPGISPLTISQNILLNMLEESRDYWASKAKKVFYSIPWRELGETVVRQSYESAKGVAQIGARMFPPLAGLAFLGIKAWPFLKKIPWKEILRNLPATALKQAKESARRVPYAYPIIGTMLTARDLLKPAIELSERIPPEAMKRFQQVDEQIRGIYEYSRGIPVFTPASLFFASFLPTLQFHFPDTWKQRIQEWKQKLRLPKIPIPSWADIKALKGKFDYSRIIRNIVERTLGTKAPRAGALRRGPRITPTDMVDLMAAAKFDRGLMVGGIPWKEFWDVAGQVVIDQARASLQTQAVAPIEKRWMELGRTGPRSRAEWVEYLRLTPQVMKLREERAATTQKYLRNWTKLVTRIKNLQGPGIYGENS